MNGRHERSNRNLSVWNNSWGETGGENPTLLVYVTNIPSIATLDEYKQFFEKSGKVIGIHVTNFRAIIKFERPFHADHAISRTLEKFKGRELSIVKFRPPKNNGRLRERSALEQAMVGTSGSTRHQKRSRSANMSRSRSRSSSPSRRRNRQPSASVNRSPPVQDTSVYGDSSRPSDISRAPPPNQSSWLSQRESGLPELPQQIKLLLNLMLNDNTARNLSFSQIQMLINFLEHEKEFVWGPPLEQTAAQPEQRQQPIEVDQSRDPESTNGTPQVVQADTNMAQDEPSPYESEGEEDDEISEDDKILEMLAKAAGRR